MLTPESSATLLAGLNDVVELALHGVLSFGNALDVWAKRALGELAAEPPSVRERVRLHATIAPLHYRSRRVALDTRSWRARREGVLDREAESERADMLEALAPLIALLEQLTERRERVG